MIREPGFSINRKDIFERLFSDYYGILVCYAQKYTKREDIAEDIVTRCICIFVGRKSYISFASEFSFISLYFDKKCGF